MDYICFIRNFQPYLNTLQGHRIVYYKCFQNNHRECIPQILYSKTRIIICLVELIFGICSIYYFWLDIISSKTCNVTFKIKCMAFFFGILASGNSFLWNLKLNSCNNFVITSNLMYKTFFRVTNEENYRYRKKSTLKKIMYWTYTILILFGNIFVLYATNGKPIFILINYFINISFFGSIFYEMNEIVNIGLLFMLKMKRSIIGIISSPAGLDFLYNIKMARKKYGFLIDSFRAIEGYMSLIVPFCFVLIVPIFILFVAISLDFIWSVYTHEEFLLVFFLYIYGIPYTVFARHVIIKCEKLKNVGEDITSALFRYRLNNLTQTEAAQVEMLIATVSIRKPVINVSDLFIIGTALIVSITASVITYVLVALQFQEAWMKKYKIAMKE